MQWLIFAEANQFFLKKIKEHLLRAEIMIINVAAKTNDEWNSGKQEPNMQTEPEL